MSKIGDGAFEGCKSCIVNEDNTFYRSIDGTILSKDKTKLIHVPVHLNYFEIPDCVTKIVDADSFSSGCLKELHIKNTNPPVTMNHFTIINSPWDVHSITKINLYVPKGSGEANRKQKLFSRFQDVIEE